MSEIAANSLNLPSWNEEMALLSLSLDGSIAEFRERDRDRVLGPQYSSCYLFQNSLKKSLIVNGLSIIGGPFTSAEGLQLTD